MHAAICAVLIALAGVVFWRVTAGEFFAFDDDVQVLNNDRIRSFSADNLAWMFTDTALTQRYTPLSWVAWAVVYQFFGLNPFGYHLHGWLMHLVNVPLVYFVVLWVLRLVPRVRDAGERVLAGCSALGAAAWALSPMRVEVVGCVTQVRYGEAAACAFGAILCYLAATRTKPPTLMKSRAFWSSAALYAASVLFYPSAIGLPLMLLALDVYLLGRWSGTGPAKWRELGRLVTEKWPFFAVALFAGLMTVYGRVTSGHIWGSPATLEHYGVFPRIVQAAYVFMFYVVKPFVPTYNAPTDVTEFNPMGVWYLGSLVLVIGLTVAAVAVRKRWPGVFLLWLGHLLAIFPFGGYFEHPYLIWDRYVYVHDVLFAVAAAYGLVRLFQLPSVTAAMRTAVAGGAAVVVGGLAVQASAESLVWRDSVTTMEYILREVGDHPFRRYFHWSLGKALFDHGRYEEAIAACDLTLKEVPTMPQALGVRRDALLKLAEHAEGRDAGKAAAHYAEAAATVERLYAVNKSPRALIEAAFLYHRAGRPGETITRLAEAVERTGGDPGVRLMLGEILFEAGRREEAQEQLRRAGQADPQFAVGRERILRAWEAAAAASRPAAGTAPARE